MSINTIGVVILSNLTALIKNIESKAGTLCFDLLKFLK